jgi:hypothetical protein
VLGQSASCADMDCNTDSMTLAVQFTLARYPRIFTYYM